MSGILKGMRALSRQDNQTEAGMAIPGMALLHQFFRRGKLPYEPLPDVGSAQPAHIRDDLETPVCRFAVFAADMRGGS